MSIAIADLPPHLRPIAARQMAAKTVAGAKPCADMGADVARDGGAVTLQIPVRLYSTLNLREHWAVKAKRAKQHRLAVVSAWIRQPMPRIADDLIVTITRVGKRLLDGDNLQASAKHVRDGIADCLGCDDADPRIEWRYGQKKGEYAVEIRIERKP